MNNNKGISTLTVEYTGDDVVDISVYVDKRDDDPLCEFSDVAPGDTIECSAPSQFDDKTYFVINNARRRRRRMGGYSKSKSYLSGDCVGKIKTNCESQIVGTTVYNCDDIIIRSTIDAAGQFCDATVLEEESTGADNALINGELRLETPLQVLEDMDPMIRWSLIGILVTFLVLLFVACYICIVRRNMNDEEEKKTPSAIAKSIALSTQTRLKNRVSQEDGEVVVDKDEDYYVEDEDDEEFCKTKKKPESPGPSFYDDDDLDNMIEMAVKQQDKERDEAEEEEDEYYDEEQYVE